MKPKSFSKKLALSKKTIAHLNDGDMKGVHGGIYTVEMPECRSWIKTECCHPSDIVTDCPHC